MLKLYLVRHGESAWNVKQVYTGQTDVPLSELGELQAERLTDALGDTSFETIYASPLKRAQDTAGPFANSLGMPIRLDARLAEIHHGAWEGNPSAVIREQYAEQYHAWRNEPHRVQMPEGEALSDVAERVSRFMHDLDAEYADGNILIVTHDAVLRVILLQTLGMSLEHFWRWRFDNASVSVLESMESGTFRLALLNDTHHLAGVYTNCEGQAL